MNKTAMGEQGINIIRVLVIITLISVPLIIFMTSISDVAGRASRTEICRDSILIASKTRDGAEIFQGSALSINCPVDLITIKSRDVSTGGKISWDKLNGVLAEELYYAYVKTAGGTNNPFKDLDSDGGSLCFVSSRLEVEQLYGEEVAGLPLYLAVKRIPGQKMSFYEAITGEVATAEVLTNVRAVTESGKDRFEFVEPTLVIWRISQSLNEHVIGDYTIDDGTGLRKFVNAGFMQGMAINKVDGNGFDYSEYIIVPESALGKTTGDVLGISGFGSSLPFCEHIIYMRDGS